MRNLREILAEPGFRWGAMRTQQDLKKNGWDGVVCYGYVGSLEGWGSSTDSWLVAGLSLSLDPHYGEQSWRAEDRVPLTSCLPLVQGRPQALKADSSLVPVPLSFQPGLQLGISYYWSQLKERSVPRESPVACASATHKRRICVL